MSGFSWAELDTLARDLTTGKPKSFEEAEKIKEMLIKRDQEPVEKKRKKKKKKKKKKDEEHEILDNAIEENQRLQKDQEFKKFVQNSSVSHWIYSGILKGSTPEMTEALIRSTFEKSACVNALIGLKNFEKTIPRKRNDSFWNKICDEFYQKYHSEIEVQSLEKNIENTEYKNRYYREILLTYTRDIFLACIQDLDQKGIFRKFDRKKEPLLLIMAQKDLHDVFPVIDAILPAKKLMEGGLIPPNFLTFNPFGQPFLCCGLFYSFSLRYNLFYGFYENRQKRESNLGLLYYSVIFDRCESNIRDLLKETEKISTHINVNDLTEAVKFMDDGSQDSTIKVIVDKEK